MTSGAGGTHDGEIGDGAIGDGAIGDWPTADDPELGGPWWEEESTLHRDDFPRSPRSRVVRVVALVLAGALLLAAFGTGIEVFFTTGGSSAVPSRVVSVGPGATSGTEQVTFEVTGSSSGPVTCVIDVVRDGSTRGSRTVQTAWALVGGTARFEAVVPVAGQPFEGTPANARVTCGA